MYLKETIKRVLNEETKIPTYILRRINFEKIFDSMLKNSLYNFNGDINDTIKKGAGLTALDRIPFHKENSDEVYPESIWLNWCDILANYLINEFGEKTKEYLEKTFTNDSFVNDGFIYAFIKNTHSSGSGGSGFSEAYLTWGDLIKKRGRWFPINWWEVKSKLDKIDSGKVLILKPNEEHNSFGGYYFFIEKVKQR